MKRFNIHGSLEVVTTAELDFTTDVNQVGNVKNRLTFYYPDANEPVQIEWAEGTAFGKPYAQWRTYTDYAGVAGTRARP